jgi:hypothetical protein
MIEIHTTTDGAYCVVYHAPDGLHHDFFSTQADALEFCRVYYGVIL